IRADFAMLPFRRALYDEPFDVGVHVISYEAREGAPAVSSPDCLHRDGEPYFALHLLRREDAVGGGNIVAHASKRTIAETCLEAPFDTLVIDDSQCYHAVTPLERGRRVVLIIDFCPTAKVLATAA